MNDQHQEGASQNGWSSRIDTTGIATAEPVDRRWFEEALRAQGFLVEPPALDDDSAWSEPLDLDAPSDDAETDDAPLAVEAEADIEAEIAPEPEPQSGSIAAAPPPASVWPIHGTTPARLTVAAPVTSAAAVPMTTRQAVAPTTLAADVSPVPTPALAARLARGTTSSPPYPSTTPVVDSGPTTADAPAYPAPSLDTAPATTETIRGIATPTDPVAPADPWTLPALQADLAAERLSGATSSSGDAVLPQAETPPPVVVAAAIAPVPVDQGPREVQVAPVAALESAAVGETPEPIVAEAADVNDHAAVTDPAVTSDAELSPPVASAATVTEPRAPFAPPAAGIAAIARRPPVDAGSATVDGGESDLWGLVADPGKSSSTAGTASQADPSTQSTTILLTVFVAIVVVVLVLGFVYLFTNLL